MKILVTGSSGHLGEALMRKLAPSHHEAVGVDIKPSRFTHRTGSIVDRDFVKSCVSGVDAVIHTATLHKPHIVTHTRHDFVSTNIIGTLNLLEESVATGVQAFVFTSTTSVYGHALIPDEGEPTAWINERVRPVTKNVYGVTKLAAEDLCEMFYYRNGLPSVVLRTSRFFLEEDDDASARRLYSPDNLKVNEYLHRRIDIDDAVAAHLLAVEKAASLGFSRYNISASIPFARSDMAMLRTQAAEVVKHHVPAYEHEYKKRGWRLPPGIDRVYVNEKARLELGWKPRHDFVHVIGRLRKGFDYRSELAMQVGIKGYHGARFEEGPYPVELPEELKDANARFAHIRATYA
jgi:UDP-glucose 4-epimerase